MTKSRLWFGACFMAGMLFFTSCSDNDKVSFLMEHPAIFLHK